MSGRTLAGPQGSLASGPFLSVNAWIKLSYSTNVQPKWCICPQSRFSPHSSQAITSHEIRGRYIVARSRLPIVATVIEARWCSALSAMADCYLPDGNRSASMLACGDDDGQARHCCFPNHYCLSNKLCLIPSTLGTYRGGCTTNDWDDQLCSDFCLSFADTHQGVFRCNDYNDGNDNQFWACRTSECGTNGKMFAVGTAELLPNKKLSDVLDLPASATAMGESPTTTSVEDVLTCELSGVSTGAAVGIGLGTSLPLLAALAAVSWLFWIERKRVKNQKSATGHPITSLMDQNGLDGRYYAVPSESPSAPVSELPIDSTLRSELDGTQKR